MMPVVAYVSQQFPSLTTTFVYREVMALRRAGLTIHPISTWRPEPHTVSEEAVEFVDETFYIFPLRALRLLIAHLGYLVTRPARYLSTLGLLALFNREPLANRLRLLIHFGYAVYVSAEIERRAVSHIHADFALNAATVALVASRLTGKPFSFTAHAADIFVNPILLREKIAAARFVVAISEYNRQRLIRVAGDDRTADKIHVVHCGVAVDEFVPPRRTIERVLPTLLAVGRLTEKKGFPYLIQACRILAERGYRFQCRIVGGGPEEARLRRLIVDSGLLGVVSLEGPVLQQDLRRYWDEADAFVLPSIVAGNHDRDGIPVVLMEAMALEIPCVSTNLSGIPELIQDGIDGVLVPQKDAAALAEALASLLDDADRRERIGAAGRRRIEQAFNVQVSARRLLELFQESAEKKWSRLASRAAA